MRSNKYLLMIASAFALCAGSASAATISTPAIAAVTVTKEEISVPAYPAAVGNSASCKEDTGGKGQACYLRFADNPGFFKGTELCISGLHLNWAVKRDGTLVTNDPIRKAYCAPIGADGKVSVTSGYSLTDGVPFIVSKNRIIAWASRADLQSR